MASPFGHQDSDPSLQELVISFIEHVERVKVPGQNGRGESRSFVPFSELDDYWEHYKIQKSLDHSKVSVPPSIVRSRYLRIFSTLVYIDRISYLYLFTKHPLDDNSMPHSQYPTHWPDAPPIRDMFDKFRSCQWIFFPLVFSSSTLLDIHLDPERILPLEMQENITVGDSAVISKVHIHESCNKLGSECVFVLKTYQDEFHRNLYNNERSALVALQSKPSDHVIRYYGSFEQNGSLNLVLEYVSGGDFLAYLRSTEPPQTVCDIRDFWKSILGVLIGFHHIHQQTQHHEHAHKFIIVHQDIKPDNIFVGVKSSSSSRYDFQAKIADFGCSHVQFVLDNGQESRSPDHHGNQTYSAPECSHHAPDMQYGPDNITPEADIWGLGCILSEVAAWVAHGHDMIETYREMRRDENRSNQNFHGSGYDECFHNGSDVLRSVEEVRQLINQSVDHDPITPQLLAVIHESMIVADPHGRMDAKRLRSKFDQVLQDFMDPSNDEKDPVCPLPTITNPIPTNDVPGLADNQPSTVQTPTVSPTSPSVSEHPFGPNVKDAAISTQLRPSPNPVVANGHQTHARRGSMRGRISAFWSRSSSYLSSGSEPLSPAGSNHLSPYESSLMSPATGMLTVDDILDYRKAKKSETQLDSHVHANIEKLKTNLKYRDHFFFIDDSPSMAQRTDTLIRAFTAFSYLAKLIDSNGIEMAFASNPRHIYSNRNTRELIEILKNHPFTQESGLMEDKLGGLVDREIITRLPRRVAGHLVPMGIKKSKPISLFILTDGCWGKKLPKAAGVETPVSRLMRKIQDRRLTRTQAMLQFVRFGDDPDGKKYLDFLDNFAQDTDIVDTRSVDGNVYDMFIGALAAEIDKKRDGTDDVGGTLIHASTSTDEKGP